MKNWKNWLRCAGTSVLAAAFAALSGCGGGSGGGSNNNPPPPVTTYVLTVNTTNPTTGVAITVAPADNTGAGNGSASFSRTYNAGTSVTITAPASAGVHAFSAWSGCTTVTTVTCKVTLNANTTITAAYTSPAITVTPNAAIIGTQVQFKAALPAGVSGNVTWSVAAPSGSGLSAGTISSSGLYNTPYPAPATVTVTATSVQDTSVVGSATVTLSQPAASSGPALSVDAGNVTHAINPLIYGMNAFQLAGTAAKSAGITVDRWGGDATSRYNYQLDVTSSASDWYFENHTGATGVQDTGAFSAQVQADRAIGAKTIGTVPVNGWVAKDGSSCSYPKSVYPNQAAVDPYGGVCGNGMYPQGVNGCTNSGGCNITGVAATVTSTAVDATWTGNWVKYLVSKFGTAASGGVAIYDLDNEPSWWDAVHRDVHPAAFTYDEVTNNGIAHAAAIKAADPSAEVSGPVMDYWWAYFYSKKDIENGWGNGSPCWAPWSNPVDRDAHGGVPLIEYYLQQFAAYEKNHGTRLLDYLDLHTYFAPSNLAFSTGGDTQTQEARLNSTRVFWDATYTDPNFQQPNYRTDANYTPNCNPPAQAPQVIPMMKKWVAADYPGTKLAITEYNWGGQESISGALAQADILGIFGREGLDIGTLWGAPDPATQVPGLMAFEVFRNYDGAGATFGNEAVSSASVDQGKLSIYGSFRTKDNVLVVVVINKTYGDLNSSLNLGNFNASGPAQVWLYSAANLNAIVSKPSVAVSGPTGGGTSSSLMTTFPAQSITILAIPKV
ncbi:glycoside hydrolase family 44 protein [Occallatibacter savannae]|uniref:glycoside hydrolase family 44 protein n=1 Tax=Occallatibacter savannae TaxID=1002691 RepID=UPI0013A5B949|nr:glycoside hydrolase family 44 protein [Occallatibacter savannae]